MSIQDMIDAGEGLLEIAQEAMPDTFYATDSRVKSALEFIAWCEKQTGQRK